MSKPWEEDCDFIENYNTEFADVSIEYEQAVGRVVDELRAAKAELLRRDRADASTHWEKVPVKRDEEWEHD